MESSEVRHCTRQIGFQQRPVGSWLCREKPEHQQARNRNATLRGTRSLNRLLDRVYKTDRYALILEGTTNSTGLAGPNRQLACVCCMEFASPWPRRDRCNKGTSHPRNHCRTVLTWHSGSAHIAHISPRNLQRCGAEATSKTSPCPSLVAFEGWHGDVVHESESAAQLKTKRVGVQEAQ
jgi:hypothetical protein